MALLEDKIDQIPQAELRDVIRNEVKKLKSRKRFGLSFEQHIPEVVPIFSAPIKLRSSVAKKNGNLSETYRVENLLGENVEIIKDSDGSLEEAPIDSIVVVKQFGEAIYPALIQMDQVKNGGENSLHHVLIEADNYHALQLLEYIYANRVDCIYIDPPYNTGARDWKYNNDYIDLNDAYRHSKWLSMMQKRLALAKQLLKRDGVLILTIDDYELYHIGTLLEEIFPDYDDYIVTIEHNKRGRRGKNFAKTNEFALFLVPKGQEVIQEELLEEMIGGETRNLRRTGSGSLRTQRWRKFFPIYVNEKTLEIVGAGNPIPLDQQKETKRDGDIITVWPIDENGVEKNWHYGLERTQEAINQGKLEAREQSYGIQIYYTLREKQSKKYKTVWSKSTLDASTYGTELLAKIMGRSSKFDFPKSVYAVQDCINAVVSNRESALILDFFAGSGTTLHSVLMLNEAYNKQHQCILVTNNEISGDEAERLEQQGYYPGQPNWEKHGVCRSVTFPRSKYTILGKRDDGTSIEGEYTTGRLIAKEKQRNIKQLGFADGRSLNTSMRKQLVALIDGIPQSKIRADMPFFIDEQSTASILFDDSEFENFLKNLEEYMHVTDIYIMTQNQSQFRRFKDMIIEKLGHITVKEEEKRPFSDGFQANLDYFSLDFLEPNEVAMGMQFDAILPILWMMSGAKGDVPIVNEALPYVISESNSFAILLKEQKFAEFASQVCKIKDLTHVFIVTNSEDAFFEMKAELKIPNVLMLYKNYLKNFELKRQWKD
ncbi:site-specific DNA-methyltransferase [Priestia megaterium]|uniref:site-specific DNA-methyltransferase n=1 Tax=Priestia megaterium TaxID=1404 RepID=UPI0015CF3482|nr:DNA methyltransferase [Priestia megaterium]